MKRMKLEGKARLLVAGLLAAVLLVWLVYFWGTRGTVDALVQMGAQQAALRTADSIEECLLEIEHLLFAMQQREEVYGFAAETDPLAYHQRAAGVQQYLDTQSTDLQHIDSLVVFSGQNVYYRFKGDLGNSALRGLYNEIGKAEGTPLMVELSGIRYIACTMPVQQGGRTVGTVAALVDEGRLRAMVNDFGEYTDVVVGLVVNGDIVISSSDQWEGLPLEQMQQDGKLTVRVPGFLSAQIVVGTQNAFAGRHSVMFALTAIATGGIFVLLMVMFSQLFSRHFVEPIARIMQGVQRMGEGTAQILESCGDEDFDLLSGKINEMAWKLEEHNRALLQTRLQLQKNEIARQQAEIMALKKQISAHFTVNTLTNIRLLAEQGEMEKAAQTCDGLSQLLSYANAGDEHISCMDEFLVLEQYVDIMMQRYPERFTVDFEVDDRLVDVEMPRMLVQPLLENAIVYGVHDGGHIHVRAMLCDNTVQVTVQDNGAGMSGKSLTKLRRNLEEARNMDSEIIGLEKVALRNIARRLYTWFGANAQILVESEPGRGTTVNLRFPAQGFS